MTVVFREDRRWFFQDFDSGNSPANFDKSDKIIEKTDEIDPKIAKFAKSATNSIKIFKDFC